jgi:hypothetical protein
MDFPKILIELRLRDHSVKLLINSIAVRVQSTTSPRSCIRCLDGGYLFCFDAGTGGASFQAEFGASRLS